jgi:hypothetical protein
MIILDPIQIIECCVNENVLERGLLNLGILSSNVHFHLLLGFSYSSFDHDGARAKKKKVQH